MLQPALLSGALNLAPDPHDQSLLRPARVPSRFTTATGTVLCKAVHPRGTSLVVSAGQSIKFVDYATGQVQAKFDVGATIGAAFYADSQVTVLTSKGPWTFEFDASTAKWVDLGPQPAFPPLTIVASETVEVVGYVVTTALKSEYPRYQGRLSADDREALTADLRRAYSDIIASASAEQLWVQPSLMCYRLLDSRGQVLYQSSPVLVAPECGFQFTETLSTTVDATNGTRNGFILQGRGWSPQLLLGDDCAEVWRSRVATLEVLATPQIHPVDFDESADGFIATNGSLTFTLPGRGASAQGAKWRRAVVSGLVERSASAMSVVARIPNPFSPGALAKGERYNLTIPADCDSVAQISAQKRVLAKAPTPLSTSQLLFGSGQQFMASAVAQSGNIITYANPMRIPFAGHPLGEMSTTLVDGSWRAALVVTMADGTQRAVWQGSGTAFCPQKLNPVLTYPDASAVKMELFFTDPTGRNYRHELKLTAATAQNIAYYVHPTVAPWVPSAIINGWTAPEGNLTMKTFEGYVAAANTSQPLQLLSLLRVAPTHIHDIVPASRASTAFDFGKAHFYAASAWGIASIATSATKILTGATLIDRRGVAGPGCLALASDCTYALASGAILRLSGNRSQQLATGVVGSALGWTSANGGEVWVTDGGTSNVKVYHPEQDCFSRRSCQCSTFWGDGSTLLAIDDAGMRRVAFSAVSKVDTSPIYIEFATTLTSRHRRAGASTACSVRTPIAGTSVEATVEVYGSNHRTLAADIHLPTPCRLAKFTLSGPQASPRVIIDNARRRYIHLSFSGKVSPDSIIQQ